MKASNDCRWAGHDELYVTGAKPVAWAEILLAPTRGGSIQPDYDRPG